MTTLCSLLSQSLTSLLALLRVAAAIMVMQATLFVFSLYNMLSNYGPELQHLSLVQWQQGIDTLWFGAFDVTIRLAVLLLGVIALKQVATYSADRSSRLGSQRLRPHVPDQPSSL
ncbi:hypothetical protein [Vibrio sp. ER1A]|uniref:hypothetical protein n=1 Tax=Vibrio sp. ER1A TaxID=1517681 RepID=UPI0004DCE333|nr:hypothetical protein [Vibrio sp. ER1A]KFA99770.1 hypothetical protein HW45_01710 [Vibrio sp. ER1A]